MKPPAPIELSNSFVTLKPLSREDAAEFLILGRHTAIWDYLPSEPFSNLQDAEDWIRSMLRRSENAGDIPFSVYDNTTNRLAGSTSYLDIRPDHAGLEIGYTWYGSDFQRTHVNTAAKLALFRHAFEDLEANRVQLQTDRRNVASQRAIERLGAVKEGVLRKHKTYPDGYVRDTVMYSVTCDEWSTVKERLEGYLRR